MSNLKNRLVLGAYLGLFAGHGPNRGNFGQLTAVLASVSSKLTGFAAAAGA